MYRDLYDIYLALSNDLSTQFDRLAARVARHEKVLGYGHRPGRGH
jgi:hypothetical protein